MKNRTLVALALAAAATFSVAVPAHAEAPNITWQVQPTATSDGERSQIDASASPGETVTDSITIRNLGDADLTLTLESFDIVKTPAGDITIPAEPSDDPLASAWVTFSTPEVSLPTGSQAEVPFSLSLPADAGPGDYAVALMASMSQPTQTADGQQVLLDTRVGVRLYLRVLGDMRSEITISGFDIDRQQPWWNPLPSKVAADIDIANTGNVRLDSSVTLRLEGPFGIPLGETAQISLPQLSPGDAMTLSNVQTTTKSAARPALFTETIAPFFLTVKATIRATEVSSGQEFEFVATETAVDVPWALVIAAAVALVTVVALRRRRTRISPDASQATSHSDE
ncbi:COG1361 family protein [Microbacterium saperdae]